MENIKQKVLEELNKHWFPNLKFLYSDEVLDISLEILDELLKEEKKKFEDVLKIEKKDLTFDSFEDESLLDYFWSLLDHFKYINNTEKIRNIIEEFIPKLDDFWNYIAYNKEYYLALKYVNENTSLDEEQTRIMYLRLKDFKDRWINLPTNKQEKIKKINKKLSKLTQNFLNNITDNEGKFEYFIEKIDDIKNLPKEILELTSEKAKEKWLNWYLFDSDPTNYSAIMKYSDNRKIRQDFEKTKNTFASYWKYDNRRIILQILNLKDEKAKILWYKNYAEYSLNYKMAESPKQVIDLINDINKKSYKKAKEEIKYLKNYFKLRELNSYDLAYYSRKLKEEKYEIDEKELKKYFEFENVLKYLFDFVKWFYWIELKQIDIEKYDENIRIFEVYKDWNFISYYFLDPFYRKNKKSWAWANELRDNIYFWKDKKKQIVVNVCNFQKNKNTLLSIVDVETIFHEFWHAIHQMLSQSKYPELSWNQVEWDFVELPSQIHENWVMEKESLEKLAKHYETGEKLSDEIISRLEELKTFMSWCFVVMQNQFALLDMFLYSTKTPENIKELDNKILEIVNNYSIFERKKDYKMYCSFAHIFSWAYSAWYYSYMWAEIIEADVFAKIKEMWMFDRQVWEKFINTILWQGTRKKASELFFDFMWREVDNKAFLERKGL